MKDETIHPWALLMDQTAYSGPLCHLEQAEPLIPLGQPGGEALTAALTEGRPVPLCPRETPAEGLDTPVAVADLNGDRLSAALAALSARTRRESSVYGHSGLCLAEGRLFSVEGVSAPLLLWPVQLEQRPEGWQLVRSGEGQLLNRPALDRLAQAAAPPEEEWSLNREPLYRQIDQILADAPDWRRQNGLWLGDFPLWLLERPDPEQLLPADSFGARLQDGALIDPAPLPERDDIQGEANVLAPLPLDGGQMSALRYVLEGNSLIAEGHHGTGKTQLAAALMANAIGDRKRVLLVSPSVADRRSALERMEEMGLDRLCLSLPVRGDSRRTVLHQFNVAAQLRPTTAAEDYFSLAAAVLSLSGQLDRTAADLHTPCRCGLTPFELVCRYSEEREAEGYLPISEHVAAELDPDGLSRRLSCIDDLTDAAGALGTPWNHPLALIQGETYDPERAAQLPQAEDALRSAIFRLNEAAWTWLDETGVTRPSTREDWGKLAQAARLLVKWRDYPDHWADSPRVPLLSDTVQELKSRTDLADKLRREIAEQWGEDILSLDAVSLEQQWKFHKAEWSLPSEPDRESAFRRLSVEAEALLNRLEQCGRRWSKCVNVPVPGTRDSWERYYEVAVELARWKEIPSEWGSCKGLQALLWDVGELIDAGKQAKESKEVLLRDWTEAFLSQNGKELLADWETEGGSWGLGLLKRQNSTRAVIEPFCKTKLTTDLAESGLRWLADYQEELAQCDEIYHRWERELRSVYRREETVWVWLEAARRVAAESHDWLSELTGSEDFLLRYGSDREAVAAAGELQELWERSREVLGRLDVMIGRTGQPDSKDWLSDRRNDCRRLRNLIKIRNHLEELATEPVPLGEIAGVLSALARRQREEEALDALYHRWEHELAGLYEGTETDWDTLYPLSLQAVESDDRIAENTGDLELRAKFARNEEILSLSAELADAIEAVQAAEGEMEALVSARLSREGGDWLVELQDNSRTIIDHLDQLELWMRWHGLCRQAEGLGLGSFAEHYAKPVPEGEDTAKLFRKSLYRALVLQELERAPSRKQFSSRQFGETLGQYTLMERQFTRRTREELFHVAAAAIPNIPQDEELQEELNLLRWANRTGAKDIALSELLRGLPKLTALLFPCVIASPADALRCFGPDLEGNIPFDYVVIDHAGQLPLPLGQAVLGLGRTALLLSAAKGETDHPLFGREVSLTVGCKELGLPAVSLEQCYLTRPESLGQPDRDLYGTRPLPSPRPERSAFRYKTVVGRMDGPVNPAEAAAVAEQALLLSGEDSPSFVIIAMTWEQADLIRLLLAQSGGDGIEVLTPEEAVCGKWQRVLLSLTIGANSNEQLTDAKAVAAGWKDDLLFSHILAAATGEVWVFSSLDEQDRPQAEAVSAPLARFLSYVRQEQAPCQIPVPRDRIQSELCQGLSELGYLATPGPRPVSVQVRSKDRPDLPPLGLLLDDADYGRILRTREREVTIPELLRAQGWPLCRVWTLDWWRSRRHVLDAVAQQMDRLCTRKPARTVPAAKVPREEPVPLYTRAKLTVMGIRSGEVSSPAFQNRVYRVVEEILLQEAPMAVPQLTERMLKAFGLDDQDEELAARCASLWQKLGLRITHEEERDYVWLPSQDPDRYRLFRRSGTGEHFRRPEDVPCQESANAVCAVLKEQLALSPEELAMAAARKLGYKPWSDAALDCGRRGVEHALFLGRAEETAVGSVVLNPRKK